MSEIYKDIIVNSFTEEAARSFREQIISRAIADNQAPIVIYIDSYGGYLDSLNSMLETIEQIPNPIITVCQGKAMSCGAVLLAAGDYRFCGRNSRIMVHQGSSGIGGPIESLQNDVDESKRINKQLMQMISSRCGMSIETFKKEMKKRLHKDDDEARDLFLSAEGGLELGIIDFIGMPHIKPVVQYVVEVAPKKTYDETNTLALEQPLTKEKSLKKKKVIKKVTKKKFSKKNK